MTVRTTSRTVTFMHPFSLSGTDEAQPAGTYTVETDEELLQASSIPAYRRIATLIRLARTTGTVQTQIVETNPAELARALARDAQPDDTMPQPVRSEPVAPRKRGEAGWDPSVKAGNITTRCWPVSVLRLECDLCEGIGKGPWLGERGVICCSI
jgi:hypothetical protein